MSQRAGLTCLPCDTGSGRLPHRSWTARPRAGGGARPGSGLTRAPEGRLDQGPMRSFSADPQGGFSDPSATGSGPWRLQGVTLTLRGAVISLCSQSETVLSLRSADPLVCSTEPLRATPPPPGPDWAPLGRGRRGSGPDSQPGGVGGGGRGRGGEGHPRPQVLMTQRLPQP